MADNGERPGVLPLSPTLPLPPPRSPTIPIPSIGTLVAQTVALANVGAPYRFTYFLPGKGQLAGSTWDDVMVVAVKR